MPRSKNRVLEVTDNGKSLKVQFQRDDGEVVVGEYVLAVWAKPPKAVRERVDKILRSPPIGVARRGRIGDGSPIQPPSSEPEGSK